MAKRTKTDEPMFDENVGDEAIEQAVAEGAPKKERKPSKRKVLTDSILEYVRSNDDLPTQLKDMVVELDTMPKRGGAKGERGPSIAGQLKELILGETRVHEDKLWEQFKIGRLEAKRKFYNMRHPKKVEPDNRIYVKFDKDTHEYVLMGQGPDEPDGFND